MQYSHWRHSDIMGRRYNTVVTVTTPRAWQPRNPILFPTGAKYLYSLKRPYRLRGPPSHRVNAYRCILHRQQSCWDVNPTTHVHLVRSSRKSGVISPLPHVPSRREQGWLYKYIMKIPQSKFVHMNPIHTFSILIHFPGFEPWLFNPVTKMSALNKKRYLK
jgi:hypothetical protein